jgi:hypothetical protein
VERPGYEANVAALRQAVDAEAFEAAWRTGQALPLEQALVEALASPAE